MNTSTDFERWPEISIPTSLMTAIASGRTAVGRVPAEWTSKRSPSSWRSNPSAIWDRAELPVQRIKTVCLSDMHFSLSLEKAANLLRQSPFTKWLFKKTYSIRRERMKKVAVAILPTVERGTRGKKNGHLR